MLVLTIHYFQQILELNESISNKYKKTNFQFNRFLTGGIRSVCSVFDMLIFSKIDKGLPDLFFVQRKKTTQRKNNFFIQNK